MSAIVENKDPVQFHSISGISGKSLTPGYFYWDSSNDRFYLATGTNSYKELTNEQVDALKVKYTHDGSSVQTVKGALDELYSRPADFSALDGGATIASKSGDVVTIKGGVTEVDGVVSQDNEAADVVLAAVASTGAAANVSIADAGDNYTATNVEGALAEIPGMIDDKIGALDTAADISIASKNGDVVTIKGSIKEEDGIVKDGAAANITLAGVATTGAADDVAYDNTTSGLEATDVQAAIDEVAAEAAGGVNSKTVWLNPDETVTSGYLKTYGIYQGANSYDADTNPATLIGKIDIPKDLVVTSGTVGTVETADVPYTGAKVGDKYIELTIANQTEHLYIPVKDLVDVYTAQQNATQVQLAISNSNEISATIVAGSIGTTELAANAVTTAKIADENVTEDKLSQAVKDKLNASVGVTAVTEGATDGTVNVTTNGTAVDVPVHGLAEAAYMTSSAIIATLNTGADATHAQATAVPSTTTKVISAFEIVDGAIDPSTIKYLDVDARIATAISTVTSNLIGAQGDAATANTIYGAKKYADEVFTWHVTA